MTGKAYEPRAFCSPSKHFGTSEDVVWRVPVEAQEAVQRKRLKPHLLVAALNQLDDRMLAARYQHDLVVLIRAALDDRRLSLKDHAAHEGFDYTRTTRMLRGEIVMKLEDIAAQHRTLGIAYPV